MPKLFHRNGQLDPVAAQIVTNDDGSQALRFPIVSLVADSVLNWYYVPSESVRQSVDQWVGRPLTINHPPEDDEAAVAFLADHANVAGRIVESRMVGSKLVHIAEMPYPGETATKKALAQNILDGKIEEVSTGYVAFPEKRDGEAGGKRFSEVHRDIAPDHLALLPGGVGACSISDGCGTLRVNTLMTARNVEATATETGAADLSLATYVARWNADHPESAIADGAKIADMPVEARKWIASHTLLGDPNATNAADLLAYPVKNPATGALNRAALIACLSNRQAQIALGAERRKSLRNTATALLSAHFPTANAAAAANQELDLEDRLRLVTRAIWDAYAPGEDDDPDEKLWPYVQSVTLDHAVFEQGAATYRVNYELTEVDGLWSVALGERVRGSMQFVADTTNRVKQFFRRLTGNSEQGDTMTRNELIKKVAGKLAWTEELTAKTFANASDCDLAKLVDGETKTPETEAKAADVETKAADPVTNTAKTETPKLTREQVIEAVPEFGAYLAQHEAAKAKELEVRNAAKAKASELGLTEADIDATPIGVLKQIMAPRHASNYAAAAGAELFGGYDNAEVDFDPRDVLSVSTPPVTKKIQ